MFFQLSAALAALQLTQALTVYLHPERPSAHLNVEAASATLSQHLGLEILEPFRDSQPFHTPFVGQGSKSALVMAMHEIDAKAILPPSLPVSFELSSSTFPSVSPILSSYISRAQNIYDSVFNTEFDSDWKHLGSLLEETDSAFVAVHLTQVARLRAEHGSNSEEYTSAVAVAQAFFNTLLKSESIQLAVLAYPTYTLHMPGQKRQESARQTQQPFPSRPLPQEPIEGVSTCFTTVDSCNNGTSTCSGKGQCVKATKGPRTCFVCACGSTTIGEGDAIKTDKWVGESCERKDVSAPFILFIGTGLVLTLLVYGSISLLYNVGTVELPSTLMGGAVNARRD